MFIEHLIQQEQETRAAIFKYFGYVEDWRVLPFSDDREYYWKIDGPEDSFHTPIRFASSIEELESGEGESYENTSYIYTNRHLPKWVYRGPEYTMIVADTHTDGNQVLQIFTNAKECR